MPKFTINIEVKNTGTSSVTAHVGASLVGINDYKEFFNTSEDYKYTFKVGTNYIVRYLTSNLGDYQKYNLHVALWEAAKPIGFPYYIVRFKLMEGVAMFSPRFWFPYYIVRFKLSYRWKDLDAKRYVSILHSTI